MQIDLLINNFSIWGNLWGKTTETAPNRCHPFPRSASKSQEEFLPLRFKQASSFA